MSTAAPQTVLTSAPTLIKPTTSSSCRSPAAMCSGVIPLLLTALTLAPWRARICMADAALCCTERCRAVWPLPPSTWWPITRHVCYKGQTRLVVLGQMNKNRLNNCLSPVRWCWCHVHKGLVDRPLPANTWKPQQSWAQNPVCVRKSGSVANCL